MKNKILERLDQCESDEEYFSILRHNEIISTDSFGIREIYNHYLREVKTIDDIFYPDAFFYSSKIRLIDIFRKPYYGVYSEWQKEVVIKKLQKFRLGFLKKYIIREVIHPYKTVNQYSSAKRIINKKNNSILFVLPKSSAVAIRNWDVNLIEEKIEKLLEKYDEIGLLVYYTDLEKFKIAFKEILELPNLKILNCGSRYDALFYFRLNYYMTKYGVIAYMYQGSHSIYASISDVAHINYMVEPEVNYLSSYQKQRYPNDSELIQFNNLFNIKLCSTRPQKIEELKLFLEYDAISNSIERFILIKILYNFVKKYIILLDIIDKLKHRN